MNCLDKKMPALVSALAIILIAVIGCRKEDTQIIADELRATASNNLYLNPVRNFRDLAALYAAVVTLI